MLPGELEADGKQIGSLNDHKLQCQLCLFAARAMSWRLGGKTAPPSPCPRQETATRGHRSGFLPVCYLTCWGWGTSIGPNHVSPRIQVGGGAGEVPAGPPTASPREAGAAGYRPRLLQGRGRPGRRDGITAKIRFTNEAHGRSNFAITHSLLCN